ncbi:MAG: DUF4864 domain-containing protein [Spirochaetaceae bacterium]
MIIEALRLARAAVLAAAVAVVTLSCATTRQSPLEELSVAYPDPLFSPAQVVRIQMEAFKGNDSENRGIRIAFRFASPGNREATGPLPRFIVLMNQPEYRPMLNAESLTIREAQTQGAISRVRVDLVGPEGRPASYYFYLIRYILPGCRGCWLTEGVEAVPPPQDLSV